MSRLARSLVGLLARSAQATEAAASSSGRALAAATIGAASAPQLRNAALLPLGWTGLTTSAGARTSSLDDDVLQSVYYPPSQARVGEQAPDFEVGAVVDGEIRTVKLSDYLGKGKYVVLFFYPKDFTFVCPTEIIAFSDRAKEFDALGAQLLAASTDTEECHLAWIKTPRNRGGLGYMQIPILADVKKELSARYGVLIEKLGIALRGLFVINPQGVIQHITINDLPIGRSVDEALRVLQAIQYHAQHGEVCPADWQPGSKTMVADSEKSLDYFATVKEADESVASKATNIKSVAEFKALVAGDKPTVVDFWAPWCGKCRQIAPFVEELVDKYPTVSVAKVDTTASDELQALAAELGVKALPAFRFFKGGAEVAAPVLGYKKKPLEDAVAALAK